MLDAVRSGARQVLCSMGAMIPQILIALFLVSLAIFAAGVFTSVEGYEDEEGFHYHWHNDRPDAADISCVWC